MNAVNAAQTLNKGDLICWFDEMKGSGFGVVTYINPPDRKEWSPDETIVHFIEPDGKTGLAFMADVIPLGFIFDELPKLLEQIKEEASNFIKVKTIYKKEG